MRIISLFSCLVFMLFITSCGGSDQQNTQDEIQDEISGEEIEMELEEEDEPDEIFMLPSPLQIGSIFRSAGLKFQDGITNDPAGVSNYETRIDKSLMLGMYFADMTYCVLNDQAQQAKEYLKAMKLVADDIGMSSIFEGTNLLDRFENNIGNQDSVLSILIDVQDRIDFHIHENDQDDLEAIIFSGGWVEGMYLGANSPREDDHAIPARLAEQMNILKNLVGLLEQSGLENEKLISVRGSLSDLLKYYEDAEIVDNDNRNVGYNISEEHVNEISSRVESMRNVITSNS